MRVPIPRCDFTAIVPPRASQASATAPIPMPRPDSSVTVSFELTPGRQISFTGSSSALEEPVKLICLPGVSSKDTVTELSGRGMGMGAVADACEALGGTIAVKSQRGIGTRIEFAFPKDQAVYEGHAAILQAAMDPVAA